MSDSPTSPDQRPHPAPDALGEETPPRTRAEARASAAEAADERPRDEMLPVPDDGAEPRGGTGPNAPALSPAPGGHTGEERRSDEPSHTPEAPDVLDTGSYSGIREPRGAGRLTLDGSWHQISPRYVVSQAVQYVASLAVIVVVAVVVSQFVAQPWVWIVAGVLLAIDLASLSILPRQARALGYALRADDVVFRKGILWQRIVAVPYGRMQLVDITHGPLDRAFGVAKLKMVTAAATTGVEIPGLAQPAAEALRDILIEVAETRRTGL